MGAILIEELRSPTPHGVAKKKKNLKTHPELDEYGETVLLHSLGESISWWHLFRE